MGKLRFIFIWLMAWTFVPAFAQKDLPNPPADSMMIPSGSFIIPMDTIYQNLVPAGQAPFNLKAYGLVNRFLHHHIPVKWAIRSGKSLNQADFSALTTKVFPLDTNPADTIPTWRDFAGGPFIVSDTAICGLSTQDIIQEFGDSVTVFRLTQAVSVDIRYTIVHRPKIAIFINGGNQLIHSKILDEAGIPDYDFIDAANIGNLFDCYTFVSEPHWDMSLANPLVVAGVKNFVLYGGNFLAQCQAVETYENLGRFMTNMGISLTNIPVMHNYYNADLAPMQFHGNIFENQGGSVSNWTPGAGSSWNAQTYKMITNSGTDTVVAMGTHLLAPSDTGGNAYFIGCHDYMKNGSNPYDLSNIDKVNQLRMYLNAVFIPSIDNHLWANAGPDRTIGCLATTSIGCTSAAPAGTTILWSPPTGLSCINCPNPVANPGITTNYTLSITGSNGCTISDDVTVNVVPPINTDFYSTPVCIGRTTGFLDQSTGSVSSWSWDFGDGSTSSLQNPTHTYASPGNYPVTLNASNGFGCSTSIVQTTVVEQPPVLSISSTTPCSGNPTYFTGSATTSGTVNTWNWNFGDASSGVNDSSVQQNPSHIFVAGVATVSLNVTTTYGCQASTTFNVNVNQSPVASFTNNPACLRGDVNFSDQSVPASGDIIRNYDWDFGDSTYAANQRNPVHQFQSMGNKNVQLAVTSALGCKDTITTPLLVHSNPMVSFTNPASGCAPMSAGFTDRTTSADGSISSWQWTFQGGNPSSSSIWNPVVTFPDPGSYDVGLTVTTNFGCQGNMINSQYVEVYSIPRADFCMSDNAGINYPVYIFCDRWSSDVVKWYWDFGDNSSIDSASTNPVHSYMAAAANSYQSYLVSLYVENNYGCKDTIQRYVDSRPDYSFFIPNCFTPNDDFSNKYFFGKGRGIKKFDIVVYDRWGKQLWECHADGDNTNWDVEGLDGIPSACKWDGTYNGHPVQQDVYVWQVNLRTNFNKEFAYRGHVSVLK